MAGTQRPEGECAGSAIAGKHASRVVSITSRPTRREYDGDHAGLQQLVDGWSWTTAG